MGAAHTAAGGAFYADKGACSDVKNGLCVIRNVIILFAIKKHNGL
jgi:hypothetical protein